MSNWGYNEAGDLRRWTHPGLDFRVALVGQGYRAHGAHKLREVAPHFVAYALPIPARRVCGSACFADDVEFDWVTGPVIGHLVIYEETEGLLIAHISVAAGLPLTPNCGNIIVQWDRGPNKIFCPGPDGRLRKWEEPSVTISPLGIAALWRGR